MLEQVTITPVGGSALVLGATGGITAGYRISAFEWTPHMTSEPIARFQESGQWPNYQQVQSMEIHMEGFIVGSSQSDYISKRQAMMTALVPPSGVPAQRYQATMMVEFAGLENVYALVNLADLAAPLSRNSFISSAFMATWTCDFGYWRAVDDSAVVIV